MKSKDLRKRIYGTKPTNLELEERIEAVELMMSRAFRKHEIRAAMAKKYGVDWRTVDRYVNRAKENLVKRLEKSRHDHLVESMGLYDSVIRSPDSRMSDKIAAQKRKDELLGLDAPRRIEASGPDGAAISIRQEQAIDPTEARSLLAVLFRPRTESKGNGGNGNGNGHHQGEVSRPV